MPINQFLPWATGVGANTYTPQVYAASPVLAQGVQNGQADPQLFNTTLRQSSSMIAMVAQFMADNQSGDVLDNGNIAALETQFRTALQTTAGTSRLSSGPDTGSADALAVSTTPSFGALTPGQLIVVTKGSQANATKTPTAAFNGLTPVTLLKASGAQLGIGDLPANTSLIFGVDANSNVRLLTTGISLSDVLAAAQTQANLNVLADGCCTLSVVDANHVVLKPKNGNTLFFNGAMQVIPAAGFTATNVITETGLPALPNTLYYGYAQMVSGSGTLQFSQTGYKTDGSGRNNKSNDATQRLVGMAYTNGQGQFQDTATFRGLLNYFNRAAKLVDYLPPATTVTTAGTYALGSPVPFLCWSDEYLTVEATSQNAMGTNTNAQMSIYLDGAAAASGFTIGGTATTGANNSPSVQYAKARGFVSEGMHTAQVYEAFAIAGSSTSPSSTFNAETWFTVRG